MRTFLGYTFFAFISIGFFACKKEKSASQPRLVMIRTTEGDSISWRTFSYDAQNKLSAISDSNNNGFNRKVVISYDGNGKLSQATEGSITYKFEYDDKGRIIKKLIQYPGQQTNPLLDTYSYDSNDRLVADSAYDAYWGSGIFCIVTYSYDAAGNVASTKFAETSGYTKQEQCNYDNHPVALAGKSILTYLYDVEELNFPVSKNNLLKETFDDGTIVYYTYQYNRNGLPKGCSFYDSTDPLVTYVDYFYQ